MHCTAYPALRPGHAPQRPKHNRRGERVLVPLPCSPQNEQANRAEVSAQVCPLSEGGSGRRPVGGGQRAIGASFNGPIHQLTPPTAPDRFGSTVQPPELGIWSDPGDGFEPNGRRAAQPRKPLKGSRPFSTAFKACGHHGNGGSRGHAPARSPRAGQRENEEGCIWRAGKQNGYPGALSALQIQPTLSEL
jgi:hypothetical protein